MVDPARRRPLSDHGAGAARGGHGGLIIPADLSAVVVLLRHGESTFIVEGRFQGAADAPLSPLGESQAALAGARLADPGRSPALPIPSAAPLEIVHSPLGRAAATAEAVRAAIASRGGSAPMRPEPGLAEIGQGRWEGTHRSQIEAEDGELLAAWRRTPLRANAPGGERVLDAAVRVRAALNGVVARLAEAGLDRSSGAHPPAVAGYPGPAVADAPWTLLVAHDGIFKIVLLTLLDLPLDRFWTFPFALCGITVVELRDGRCILRAHNLVEHLAPLAATEPPAATPANGAL